MNTLVAANIACLEQGLAFLNSLPPGRYGESCPEVFGSSIGGHMRHNVDHCAALLAGLPDGEVDYDARERNPAIEVEPQAAAGVLLKLREGFEALAETDLDQPLRIRMDDGGGSDWSATSLRRELQFLLSHTIHHYALMVSIAARQGMQSFPEGFGVAPSTLSYQARRDA